MILKMYVTLAPVIFAGICDLFDGKVARMCNRNEEEKEFGRQLDSLADVFSFLAFPAILGIKILEKQMYIVLIAYILAGIIRLAWFHVVTNEGENLKYYKGLPVTYMALILPIAYVISMKIQILENYLFPSIYLVVAFLFIWNVNIPKPKGIWYVVFSVMAILVTCLIVIMR